MFKIIKKRDLICKLFSVTFTGETLGKELKKALFSGVAQKNPPSSYLDI